MKILQSTIPQIIAVPLVDQYGRGVLRRPFRFAVARRVPAGQRRGQRGGRGAACRPPNRRVAGVPEWSAAAG
ncbi:PE-PGRS family protein (fragment) [Cupriavidus phytorum]|uniref:PE-PGRS family protein n=1 Tax=Cupriavidus taiwanensis TaxID=164546 RepID=A0A375C9F7_9BURK